MLLTAALVSGCGSGGYPGGGLNSLSANVDGFQDGINIDATQSVTLTASAGGTVTWKVSGCPASGCGTLQASGGSNNTAVYTAPAVVSGPFTITVAATGVDNTTKTVSITVSPAPSLAGKLAAGIVDQPYTTTLAVAGGTSPAKLGATLTGLPSGLNYNATTGIVSGTPTVHGTFNATMQLSDGSDVQQAWPVTAVIQINKEAGMSLTVLGTPGAGVVGQAYSATLQAIDGLSPYIFTLTGGSLPPGLMMDATGAISGTPTAAGAYTFVVKAQDANGVTGSASFTITVTAATASLSITPGNLPNGTVNVAYSSLVNVTGGTGPYTCGVVSGSLPAGLSFGAGCTVIGTPTAAGTFTFTVKATDSSNPQLSATGVITITIQPAQLTIATGNLPNGTVNVSYSQTIGVSGGTSPYTCALLSGSLPAGLSLGTGCTVVGTPTAPGTFSFVIKVTDSGNPQQSASGTITLTIQPAQLIITSSNLPSGVVGTAYSASIAISGGTAPYTCAIASGTMPAGLTLNANCTVAGTPQVAETVTPIIRVVDSGNPAATAWKPVSITINPTAATLMVSANLTATEGDPFSGAINVSGGTAPYTCVQASGSLPAGLTLNANCTVTGTPTSTGTFTPTITVTDSSNPQNTANAQISITVNAAPVTIVINSPGPATAGSPYTGYISVSGGTAPYTCVQTGGTLPAGLTLNSNCTVTGTPKSSGNASLTVKVTDSANPSNTNSGSVTITVNPPSVTLTLSAPPAATAQVSYTGSIGVSGGTGPYTCSITGGSLPNGLTLGSNCSITGTPATSATSVVTVYVTDSGNPAANTTGQVTMTVNPATLTLTGPSVAATVSTPYTGTILVNGGVAPYTCSLAGGSLPSGLTLNANCTVTGTPTASGPVSFSVTAKDSENPAATVTGSITVTVNALPQLTFTGSLPNAVVGVPYTQTLTASGGVGPYTYAITSGGLPAGLNFATDGTISGTPAAPGATSFTVTVTDSEGTPQTVSLPLVLLVVYPTTPQDGLLNGSYAYLFQGYDDALAGVAAYQTATVGSFTADGTGVIGAGELDSNHQTSNPTGTTISTSAFLGTYTLGTDDRGYLTITTLHADGTTDATSTYSIAVKAPNAPAKVASSGSMIEFDGDHLQGTKGSGQLLLQTTSAFASGLNGSYAFGVQGDTPCLPSCGTGIQAGPVAAVGQFTTDGNGNITAGTGDETVASTTYANSALSGSYGAADGNGRLQMSLTTMNMPLGVYPVDYAVYVVDAAHAFILSTDKHSAYVLLSGSATLQQGAFSNASLSGAYVGYENAQTNPGLVGTSLQNVLNLSTATIFRGTANSTGTCTTTNVDMGGTAALVNQLSGVGSGSNVINALLGTYQSTGNSNCTVAANGRGVINYPVPGTTLTATLQLLGLPANPPSPRVAYLFGQNAGYFLETGYAGLGMLKGQTGAPFSLGNLDGTYVYLTSPASSVVSTDTAGIFAANGSGNVQTTYDLNVGVGTVNLLQSGVTGAFTYTLTDATAGRYMLGTSTVIYATSPGSFLLLDTAATTTSPSVALLF